jgi:hypothetical protein
MMLINFDVIDVTMEMAITQQYRSITRNQNNKVNEQHSECRSYFESPLRH